MKKALLLSLGLLAFSNLHSQSNNSVLENSILSESEKFEPYQYGREASTIIPTKRSNGILVPDYQSSTTQPSSTASPRVPNPPQLPPAIPIDGGASLLLVAGASYGLSRMRKLKK